MYLFLLLFFILFIVLYWCLLAHVAVYRVCAVPKEARRGRQSSGAGVTAGCELPCGCWEGTWLLLPTATSLQHPSPMLLLYNGVSTSTSCSHQLFLHPLTSRRLEEGSPSFGMICFFFFFQLKLLLFYHLRILSTCSDSLYLPPLPYLFIPTLCSRPCLLSPQPQVQFV